MANEKRDSQGMYQYGSVDSTEHSLILQGLEMLKVSLHDEVGRLGQARFSRKESGLDQVLADANNLLLSIKILNRLQKRLESIEAEPDDGQKET